MVAEGSVIIQGQPINLGLNIANTLCSIKAKLYDLNKKV
jgi:hypothetical protein